MRKKEKIIMSKLQALTEAVIKGDEDKIKLLILELLNAGTPAKEIMGDGLIAGMNIVGNKMETEEMFIPEVLMSAKAMSSGVEILKPQLTDEEKAASGIMILGTVQGDLHDIGKNLVKMLMEGAGFSVIDLGTDVAPAAFVDAIKEHNADIVGMSALLTTTMPKMRETLEAIEKAGIRDQVKVVVGGAPVTENYADEIGADGYGYDAGSAVRIAKAYMTN
jgi:5-methyltetrahydrofolate--homocysteine methyltransferase